MAESKSKRSSAADDRHRAVDELTFTVALLYFRMRNAAEEMLGEGAQSSGRRSLLKTLAADGPQTVPHMARLRAVSRQHIQKLVDGLRADGLVELIDNPAHKRSKRVRITAAGLAVAEATARREFEVFQEISRGLTLREIRTAIDVLQRLKGAFEGERWQTTLEGLER